MRSDVRKEQGARERFVRVVVLGVALAVGPAIVSAACSQRDDRAQADAGVTDAGSAGSGGGSGAGDADNDGHDSRDPCVNGTYVLMPRFSHDACSTFVSNDGVRDPDRSRAPTWSSPKDGATLPRTLLATFSWTKGATALAPGSRDLLRKLDPLKRAYAHGMTLGDGYALIFEDASGRELLRVMTVSTSWTADNVSWEKLVIGNAVRARLVWARFVKNELAAGTKPAEGAPLSFSIGT